MSVADSTVRWMASLPSLVNVEAILKIRTREGFAMKFAKYLEAESVPEWRKKYIDYKGLKKCLKAIVRQNEELFRQDTLVLEEFPGGEDAVLYAEDTSPPLSPKQTKFRDGEIPLYRLKSNADSDRTETGEPAVRASQSSQSVSTSPQAAPIASASSRPLSRVASPRITSPYTY